MITRPKRRLFGYSRKQTDQLIREIKKDYEDELKKKRDRIVELTACNRQFKEDVDNLTKALDGYKEKERFISHAAVHAEERAQMIVDQATQRMKNETIEINEQRKKWSECEEQIKQKVLYMNKKLADMVDSFRKQINVIEKQNIDVFPKDKNDHTISA